MRRSSCSSVLILSFCIFSSHAAILEITDKETFETKVLKSTKPVIVLFTSILPPKECTFCTQMETAFQEESEKNSNIAVYKAEIKSAEKIGAIVAGFPTVIFYKNGKPIKSFGGEMNRQELWLYIQLYFGQKNDSV